MKIRLAILCAVSAAVALAQDEPPPVGTAASWNPVSLGAQFFERNNFFNYFGFANAVYDSYNPTINSEGQTIIGGGVGYSVGGGATLRHTWQKSTLALSYSGDYRHYASSFFSSGTDQNLSLSYNRRLGRHFFLNTGVSAGNILYGTGYFGQQPVGVGAVQVNPFSNSSRFLSSSVSVSYQQTRRLSYAVAGSFFLQRYSYSGAVGATGGSGDISASYRITSRTTVSGAYSRSYFVFQRNSGDSTVDGLNGSISHRFHNHWVAAASGGISHSHVTGVITLPVTLVSQGVTLSGYVTGPYDSKTNLPAFSGSVTRFLRVSSFSISGGQSVVSGNGYYLASRSQYFTGLYSRNFYKANASIGGTWSRLSSVANTVSYGYATESLGVSYSRVLARHISANGRYDFVRYGNLNPFPATADNRITVGVAYSSQSVPLGLY